MRTAIVNLRHTARVLTTIKIIGPVIGAALIATSQWFLAQPTPPIPSLWPVLFWSGIVTSTVGAAILIFFDRTTPELIAENIELAGGVTTLRNNLEFIGAYQDSLLARASLTQVIREVLEVALTKQKITDEDLNAFVETILAYLVERREALFAMGNEKWNFSVYRYDPADQKLKCIALKREESIIPTGGKQPREWRPGEGHVGLAFSRGSALIFADATREDLKVVIGAQGENQRPYDEDRYKSLASIPISTDGQEILGILIGTSDRVGRFKTADERDAKDWDREEALREVASFLAILFKMIQNRTSEGGG
jgi:GAF domain-containing protein